MTYAIGQRLTWISSGTHKTGTVVTVVPPHTSPASLGYPEVGDGARMRDHESYVVRGAHRGSTRTSLYWPLVSLLKPADGLTDEEIAWCQNNVTAVRALIARNGRS